MFLKSTSIALLDSRFKKTMNMNVMRSSFHHPQSKLPNQTISPFMPLLPCYTAQLHHTPSAPQTYSKMFIDMKMMLFKPNYIYGFCGV